MSSHFINSTTLVSNDPRVIEDIEGCFDIDEIVDVISSVDETELISIELPDLIIIDYTDWKLAFAVMDRIVEDPWLHHQNIISVCSSADSTYRIEGHKSINLIAGVSRFDIKDQLPTILQLIRKNKQLVFHRGYETIVFEKVTGSFTISNSLLEIESLINLVCSYLYNANKVDISRKNRLKTALTELLVNALEHGNCEIGFSEKSDWLNEGKSIASLINEKLETPEIAVREIRFSYEINREYSDFVIEDDGDGFNWSPFISPADEMNYTDLNGRGIIMAKTSTARLVYNDKGNRVTCSIEHKELSANNSPVVLSHLNPETVTAGSTVLKQGDRSSYLYFICKGRYLVAVDDKPVSILTPDDIFMGEMSFLLNGKRSATITALSTGSIIRISKRDFISVIRQFPYYTLFLARLLAQRLNKSNS